MLGLPPYLSLRRSCPRTALLMIEPSAFAGTIDPTRLSNCNAARVSIECNVIPTSSENVASSPSFVESWSPPLLSLLRIVAAYLFLLHGTAKLLGFPHVAQFDNLVLASLPGIAGILELVGGVLLLIGLFTRPVAFILSGQMAAAYFIGHASKGNPLFPVLNGGDAAILYCFVFLYLAAAGPGPWSVDAARTGGASR